MANFQIKNSDIFHISAQNIACGYSLEPPRRWYGLSLMAYVYAVSLTADKFTTSRHYAVINGW